ncbi:MAG: nitrate reductase molybdenum cofactor assembly chaperone [Pseudomonadota bacterium]
MTRTLKALSVLLSYPTRELQRGAGDIADALHDEALLSPSAIATLDPLLGRLAVADLYELQEGYVALFDRSRSLSLNLFEHVHGESRDRGPAMVDLLETYRAGGFEPDSHELPDHLPILLEFLSTRPLAEAREMLADAAHILEALSLRLTRRESPYAAVFDALVGLSAAAPDAELTEALAQQPDDDPDDLEALDAAWEETEVTFGPDPNAGCPVSRELLAAMDPPAPRAPSGAGRL